MKVPYVMKGRPVILDFKTKFNRYEYFDCVQSALGKILPEPLDVEADTQETRDYLKSLDAEANFENANTSAKILDKLFDLHVQV